MAESKTESSKTARLDCSPPFVSLEATSLEMMMLESDASDSERRHQKDMVAYRRQEWAREEIYLQLLARSMVDGKLVRSEPSDAAKANAAAAANLPYDERPVTLETFGYRTNVLLRVLSDEDRGDCGAAVVRALEDKVRRDLDAPWFAFNTGGSIKMLINHVTKRDDIEIKREVMRMLECPSLSDDFGRRTLDKAEWRMAVPSSGSTKDDVDYVMYQLLDRYWNRRDRGGGGWPIATCHARLQDLMQFMLKYGITEHLSYSAGGAGSDQHYQRNGWWEYAAKHGDWSLIKAMATPTSLLARSGYGIMHTMLMNERLSLEEVKSAWLLASQQFVVPRGQEEHRFWDWFPETHPRYSQAELRALADFAAIRSLWVTGTRVNVGSALLMSANASASNASQVSKDGEKAKPWLLEWFRARPEMVIVASKSVLDYFFECSLDEAREMVLRDLSGLTIEAMKARVPLVVQPKAKMDGLLAVCWWSKEILSECLSLADVARLDLVLRAAAFYAYWRSEIEAHRARVMLAQSVNHLDDPLLTDAALRRLIKCDESSSNESKESKQENGTNLDGAPDRFERLLGDLRALYAVGSIESMFDGAVLGGEELELDLAADDVLVNLFVPFTESYRHHWRSTRSEYDAIERQVRAEAEAEVKRKKTSASPTTHEEAWALDAWIDDEVAQRMAKATEHRCGDREIQMAIFVRSWLLRMVDAPARQQQMKALEVRLERAQDSSSDRRVAFGRMNARACSILQPLMEEARHEAARLAQLAEEEAIRQRARDKARQIYAALRQAHGEACRCELCVGKLCIANGAQDARDAQESKYGAAKADHGSNSKKMSATNLQLADAPFVDPFQSLATKMRESTMRSVAAAKAAAAKAAKAAKGRGCNLFRHDNDEHDDVHDPYSDDDGY